MTEPTAEWSAPAAPRSGVRLSNGTAPSEYGHAMPFRRHRYALGHLHDMHGVRERTWTL